MPLKGSVKERIREFHKGGTYAHTLHKYGKAKADAQAVAAAYESARAAKRKKRRKRRG